MSILFAVLMLATCGTVAWGAVRSRRLRSPERAAEMFVDSDGLSTVVRGMDDYQAAMVLLGVFAVDWLGAAVMLWSSAWGIALVLLGPAAYCGVFGWLYGTGRVGDGSVRFNARGVSQRVQGVEREVRWEDVIGVERVPLGVALDSAGRVSVCRLAPRAWIKDSTDAGQMTVDLTNIHHALSLPIWLALERWGEDEFARLEIGTDDATRRLLDQRG